MIRKTASYILLVSVYGFTWLVAVLGRVIPRRRWKPTGRIAVTGTIFNPNWYLSHIMPLTHCGVKEVILIIDEPMQPLDKVRFVCPPKWLAKLISRAGAGRGDRTFPPARRRGENEGCLQEDMRPMTLHP